MTRTGCGDEHGHDLMRAWLQRSVLSLQPLEKLVGHDGEIVVLEARAVAHHHGRTGPGTDTRLRHTWVTFEVRHGLVSTIRRYETAGLPTMA